MDYLKGVYEIVGPRWPTGSLIVVVIIGCVIGGIIAGGSWVYIRKQWEKDHAETALSQPLQTSVPKGSAPTASAHPATMPAEQLTLKKLFETDFPNTLKARLEMKVKAQNQTEMVITCQLYLDFDARSKFIGIFVPASPETYGLSSFFSDHYKVAFEIEKNVGVSSKMPGDDLKTTADLIFTGMIYIYHESDLSIEQKAELIKLYKSKGLSVVFKGTDYLALRILAEQHPKF